MIWKGIAYSICSFIILLGAIFIGFKSSKIVKTYLLIFMLLCTAFHEWYRWDKNRISAQNDLEIKRHHETSSRERKEILTILKKSKKFDAEIKAESFPVVKYVRFIDIRDTNMWRNYYRIKWSSYLKADEATKELIKKNYESDDRINFVRKLWAVCKHVDAGSGKPCSEGLEPEYGFSAKNVIDQMYYPEWPSRARAAYLLRNVTPEQLEKDNKNEDDVLKALIHAMKLENEDSLIVSKTALDTYGKLTGFRPDGVFDFKGAIKYEKQREKLKKQVGKAR